MPRCPPKDYVDRCEAIKLDKKGLSRRQIAQALGRPERWVRRTLARYDPQVGLESLGDRSSRPHHSPNRTPAEIEQAICDLKQAHLHWGRRQIGKQLRWRWRDDPDRLRWVSEGRVRCVLARHPEIAPPATEEERPSHRQIDYLECNILWGADIQHTKLADGSTWETIHWLDLHSRYELAQVTAACLTEEIVVQSYLLAAQRYGLPLLVKTDRDKLCYDATSGLPSNLTRVLDALGVHHLVMPKKQPWWNGVVERYIQTCGQEVHLPDEGDSDQVNEAMEAERRFYNEERCHSRCNDRPPSTVYQPSARQLLPDFDLTQVPITLQPTVVTRRVQASGRVSLGGHTYPFSRRYAGQTIAVAVDGWSATARAEDDWQRPWNLRSSAQQPPADPLPPFPPKPLTRKVNRRGCISINRYLYYLGIAWVGQTVTVQREEDAWSVNLPDGSTKTLPCKHLVPRPHRQPTPPRPRTPPNQQPEPAAFQTRRVTKTGQIAFHHHLYYVGIAHKGTTVHAVPTPEGLSVYNMDHAWITTCPWKQTHQPDKPLCPT